MTAQPSTKSLNSADFTASLRNILSSSEGSSSQPITNGNTNNNFFNSEDFQRFLNEHRESLESACHNNNDTTSTQGASSSLDQIFKTSEFFKSQQFSDLFKSQQSFSQMFQSKDSFAELFKSLDGDQKRAFFSSTDSAATSASAIMKDPLSPPVFPAMESVSRTNSSSNTRSRSSSFLFQSKDWKNLGSHVDVNYQHSKLFRDTSSSYGSDGSSSMQAPSQPQPQQQPIIDPAADAASKTNWGDFFFAQLQPADASGQTSPVAAPTNTAPVVPTPAPAPVLPPKKKKNNNNRTANKTVKPAAAAVRKQGKRYIANPTQTDILMGRGGKSNHHPGNKRYREEILNFKKTYSQLTSKEDKTDLSRHVVEYVHKYKGRFLALDKTIIPARWYEITDAVARRKVSQALREDGDPVKRQQKRARFLERKRQKELESKQG
eukprot:CAMPEP_0113638740 /NCGR_PEP_ID=MMETSP0017_2-20120614/20307_1 /TAXON_ID=2856 /ORGANISM="Cylindrotheca closterium" /LENGTH=433 /DNA_ID=CAMNT_0000549887 /DNA_START=1 /DNA_END=1302 /DNA_ORIENTATION=+ /assembly_acc=CAM_ASM_000147